MSKLVFDFSLRDVMKLSNVKRWGIVEMSREQSVAEHSYNVALISLGLIYNTHLGVQPQKVSIMLKWALCHDLPELLTGDLPTVIKGSMGDAIAKLEKDNFPQLVAYGSDVKEYDRAIYDIVKLADLIDAYQFASKFCINHVQQEELLNELLGKMDLLISSMELAHGIYLKHVLSNLWLG